MQPPANGITAEAIAELQLAVAHRALRMAWEICDPLQRAVLQTVLSGDLAGSLDHIAQEGLTESERTLVAHGIEELLVIRDVLPVGTGTGGATASD